ncbi:MAG: hypothetical protein JNJ46_20360 [Myxococcales bacterium]|nr:hypothetical protein [Myxococcales bacterium]
MRAKDHKYNLLRSLSLGSWITSVVCLLPAALAGQSAAQAHVVTAPWAGPGQAPGSKPVTLDATLAKWEPPALSASPAPPPLTPEQQAIVQATQGEKLPEPKWARYVLSNEWRHDVMFSKLANLGGVWIGVATDQNYTMAAAARSELLVLMDYDLEVVNVHRMYHALIKQAATAEDFRAFFRQQNSAKAIEALSASGSSKEDNAKLVQIYNRYRDRMATYLYHVANTRVGQRHPTWLGDPAAYAYIRGLVQGGRVLARQGDLNGTTTIRSIGDTARKLNLKVRGFYTSNAEGFFQYSQNFRDSLKSLPIDEKSVMVRTYKRGMTIAVGCTWHYNLHQISDFLSRLDAPGYKDIHRVMQDLRGPQSKAKLEAIGVSYYDGTVPRT